MDECATALGQLKPHKSPGMDGLTAEFYRQFWPVLRDDLMAVFQTIYDNGYMSLSQRTGIIRLLYKKGDRKDVGNWRPISLLNVDYKIVAKVLANRLKTVLGSIIHPDQTCTILGRSIHDNWAVLSQVDRYSLSRHWKLCLN